MTQEKSQTRSGTGFLAVLLVFLLRCPSLLHEAEQMLNSLLITAIFPDGKLMGTFIELGRHFGRFFGRASEGNEGFRQM